MNTDALKITGEALAVKMFKNKTAWSNELEIAWLDNIGNRVPEHMVGKYTKRQFLLGYIKSCKNRKDWNKIKKDSVLEHARSLLATVGRA